MNTARVLSNVSVEEYLAGEEAATVKHEYVAGRIYAMSGASREHNAIAGNLFASLHAHLRGGPCRTYFVDVKARMEWLGEEVFYYPDLMVACDPRDKERYFLRYPKVIIEVLSPTTERLDRYEKRTHYQQIETLEEYVLVEQDFAEVTIFRRSNEFQPEVIRGINSDVVLQSVGLTLPMAAIYEGVR
ncbi:Uma2 family endonuclease [Verrucomicrobiota bacterium sgz303538]